MGFSLMLFAKQHVESTSIILFSPLRDGFYGLVVLWFAFFKEVLRSLQRIYRVYRERVSKESHLGVVVRAPGKKLGDYEF